MSEYRCHKQIISSPFHRIAMDFVAIGKDRQVLTLRGFRSVAMIVRSSDEHGWCATLDKGGHEKKPLVVSLDIPVFCNWWTPRPLKR